MRAPGAVLAAAIAFSMLSSPARALVPASATDRVAARALFEAALADMKSESYAKACPKLEESQRLDPGLGTQYNLADCYEGLGRLASAWTTFSDVAEAAERAGDLERLAVVKTRVAALLPRLSHLVFTAPVPPDITLTLDGVPFTSKFDGDPAPIDPGPHELGADAPGKKHCATRFSATEGATVTLALPELEALPRPPAPPPPLPSPPAAVLPPAPATSWHVPAAIVAAGLGVVGLGIGTVFGVKTIDDWSTAKEGCTGNVCDPAHYPAWQSAHSAGTVSTVSFIVGASLVATGAVLWLTRPQASSLRVGIRPDGALVVGGRLP